MIEETALVKKSRETIDSRLASVPEEVKEAFFIPSRNWNGIIESYNAINRRKFFLTPLQCKLIVEHVKRGQEPFFLFKSAKGCSKAKYKQYLSYAAELDERFELLDNNETRTEEENKEFELVARHPLRILMVDVAMAEGVADLMNWELFNEYALNNPEVLITKLKAKYKEIFSEKPAEHSSINVEIKLGNPDEWLNKL